MPDVRDALINVLSDMGVGATDLGKMGDTAFSVLRRKVRTADRGLVSFSNGVYCIRDGVLYGFSPDAVSAMTLPYDYSEAGCPMWDAFLAEVLPDESERAVLQEFFGMCFADRRSVSIEKMALFVGSGANGKSVVCDVVRSVLGGRTYVGNLNPDQLQDAKQATSLVGKVLNIAPDVRRGAAFDSALKALSSSQEVSAWQLYHGAVTVACPPLCFALNEMPFFKDTTDAFFRRLLVFRFDVVIPEQRQDRGLASRIARKESAGVFRWIMDGYARLMSQGGMFSRSSRMSDAVRELRRDVRTSQSRILQMLEGIGYGVEPARDGDAPVVVPASEVYESLGGEITKSIVTRELKRNGVKVGRNRDGMYYNLYRI